MYDLDEIFYNWILLRLKIYQALKYSYMEYQYQKALCFAGWQYTRTTFVAQLQWKKAARTVNFCHACGIVLM